MRVKLTEHFTHNTGRLFGLPTVVQAKSVHSEKNATLYRFQSIPCIRKSSGDNNGHRIIDVSGAHFMINFHRLYNARCLFLDFVKIPYLIIHIIFQTL